jgi:mono/diheme cytochrome c family protein
MNKRKNSYISILLLIVLAGILLAACGSSSSAPASSGGTNAGSTLTGQTLMQQRCSVCHSLNRVTSAQKTVDQWKTTVDRMINNGAQISPAEEQTLVAYLAQTYHP